METKFGMVQGVMPEWPIKILVALVVQYVVDGIQAIFK
ncbi:hypothetical protein MnTg04_01105 [bacterium MnTg04]|nr:hypothetical protein MnTg04_01105 [bacterium MnTg04]